MSGPGNSNKNTASGSGSASSGGGIFSYFTSGFNSSSASTPTTTAVSAPRIVDYQIAPGADGANGSLGNNNDDTGNDVFEDTMSDIITPGPSGFQAPGAERQVSPASVGDSPEGEVAEEGLDPGFDPIAELLPLFGQGTDNDFSDMFLSAPIYGIIPLSNASGHDIRVNAENVIQVIDKVTNVIITSVPNDTFDSGRDRLNLAYGLIYRDHIPWHFTTGINMAARQMRINADPKLQQQSAPDTPYRMVWELACGRRVPRIVVDIPVDDFIRTDAARLDVEAIIDTYGEARDACAFYMGNIHDAFIPDIRELSRTLGKTMLFQPPFLFLVNKLLADFPFLKNCDDYRNSIGKDIGDVPLLGVINDATFGLVPGPENVSEVSQTVRALKDSMAALDMTRAAESLLRISRTCGNPPQNATSVPVISHAATGGYAPARPDARVEKEIELGKQLVTRVDLDALVYAIKAGPSALSYSLKECGYYDKETQKKEVFGAYMTKDTFQKADRAKIFPLFKTETDAIRQCLRLAAILTTSSEADPSKAVLQPGKAAVIHMVRSFPQSACHIAYGDNASLDYEWVFA